LPLSTKLSGVVEGNNEARNDQPNPNFLVV
jgi:hypothetical protein